jgi:hypothetical protein
LTQNGNRRRLKGKTKEFDQRSDQRFAELMRRVGLNR